MQYKNISAMIFNEIKFYVNTSLGLVGWMHPLHPPPCAAPVMRWCSKWCSENRTRQNDLWLYVQCCAHRLNLCMGDVRKSISEAEDFFAVMERLYPCRIKVRQAWYVPWAPLWWGRQNLLGKKLKFLFTVSSMSILRPTQPTAQLHRHSGLM